MTDSSSSSGIRALCLFSGGLDSQLAVCLLRDQGLAVEGLAFRSLFFDAGKAERAADRLVLPLAVEEFTPALLKLIERPRHGFGAGLNPCIDCHIAMARRAGELMRERGFRFVATGEVLNQRPMSQHRQALEQVALESGLGGLLLRPLSAQRLPETEPERLGWVDRSRLLDFHGRSRKPQMDLARRFGIAEYPQPAGGCLLTDPLYGRRLRELKAREGLTETGIRRLRLGRHFQAGAGRVIIGRNQAENERLEQERAPGEYLIRPTDVRGPTALVSAGATEADLAAAAACCSRYCDAPPGRPLALECLGPRGVTRLAAAPASPEFLEARRL